MVAGIPALLKGVAGLSTNSSVRTAAITTERGVCVTIDCGTQTNIGRITGKLTIFRRRNGCTVTNPQRHWRAKLTPEDVRDIRTLYNTGTISQARLGKAYKVSQATIHQIVNGSTWRGVRRIFRECAMETEE